MGAPIVVAYQILAYGFIILHVLGEGCYLGDI